MNSQVSWKCLQACPLGAPFVLCCPCPCRRAPPLAGVAVLLLPSLGISSVDQGLPEVDWGALVGVPQGAYCPALCGLKGVLAWGGTTDVIPI